MSQIFDRQHQKIDQPNQIITPDSTSIYTYLNGQSILILGFGREGRSSLNFLLEHREQIHLNRLAIADQQAIDLSAFADRLDSYNIEIECVSGEDYLNHIGQFTLVLKSPGISLRNYTANMPKPCVLAAWPETTITGQIDLFLRFAPTNKVIGITGTKGKSTTSSLVAQILRSSGQQTYLAGNIGVPILDNWDQYTADDAVVVELSSHQLQFVQASPRLAAITNFFEEHLDHYIDYTEYTESKLNILRYQNEDDCFVLNLDDEALVERARPLLRGRSIEVTQADAEQFRGVNLSLIGDHHVLDIALAAALVRELGLDDAAIRQGLLDYEPLPHRCEYIGTYDDILFYNDSIATAARPTILAIETLKHVDTLIVGGKDRGVDLSELILFLPQANISNVICLPDTGLQIHEALEAVQPGLSVLATDLKEAVDLAFERTTKGRSCLLSPAASSYHLWTNFEERGNEFRHYVTTHR